MAGKKHTTVVLNKTMQKIKDELSPIYGLKNILSAGLWLFSQLSDTEQKKAVAQVNKLAPADQANEIVSDAEADVAKQKRRRVPKPAKTG